MGNLREMMDSGSVNIVAYGTSEGAKKAWDTRGRSSHEHRIAKWGVSAPNAKFREQITPAVKRLKQLGYKSDGYAPHSSSSGSDVSNFVHPSGARAKVDSFHGITLKDAPREHHEAVHKAMGKK